jgi:hypothetical protein
MKYPRTLLKTLAILGPMAIAVSPWATEPAQAWSSYDWCNYYYDYYYDPSCPYPYPNGLFFSFGDRRFHHRFDRRFDHHFDHHGFDHHFGHGGFNHGGFGHGGFGHGGMGHGGGGHGGGHR